MCCKINVDYSSLSNIIWLFMVNHHCLGSERSQSDSAVREEEQISWLVTGTHSSKCHLCLSGPPYHCCHSFEGIESRLGQIWGFCAGILDYWLRLAEDLLISSPLPTGFTPDPHVNTYKASVTTGPPRTPLYKGVPSIVDVHDNYCYSWQLLRNVVIVVKSSGSLSPSSSSSSFSFSLCSSHLSQLSLQRL